MEDGDTGDKEAILTWPQFREVFPLVSNYLPTHEMFICLTSFDNLVSIEPQMLQNFRYVTVDTDNRPGLPKEVFMDSMKDYLREEIKAKKFRLYGCIIMNCNIDTNPTLVHLINSAMQPTLAKIEINVMTICGIETFHKIMRVAGKNLIDLSIIGLSQDLAYIPVLDESGDKMIFPHLGSFHFNGKSILLVEVLKCFPNLVNIDIRIPQRENPESLKGIKMPRLSQICIRGTVNSPILQEHLDCITSLGVKLTKIDITNTDKDLRAESLRQFLESHKKTLDDLNLGQFDVASIPPELTREPIKATKSPFPANLPAVTKASFQKHYIDNLASALNSMPNLQELKLSFGMETNWKGIMETSNAGAEVGVYENLTKLFLTWIHPPAMLCRLGQIFPNLIDLRLDTVTDDLIRCIFGNFSKLKYLKLKTPASQLHLYDAEARDYYLQPDHVSDRGLTGLRSQLIKTLPGDSGVIVGANSLSREYPYIGDLKKLKYLEMTLPRFRLTSMAFIYGILESKNLQKLKIKAGDFNSCPEMFQIMDKNGFLCIAKEGEQSQGQYLNRGFRRRRAEIGSEGDTCEYGSDYESGEGSTDES